MQHIALQRRKKQLVVIQTRIEPELIAKIDRERQAKGRCSRAVIMRMALLDRYPEVSEVA
jgi:hypothetical protein